MKAHITVFHSLCSFIEGLPFPHISAALASTVDKTPILREVDIRKDRWCYPRAPKFSTAGKALCPVSL